MQFGLTKMEELRDAEENKKPVTPIEELSEADQIKQLRSDIDSMNNKTLLREETIALNVGIEDALNSHEVTKNSGFYRNLIKQVTLSVGALNKNVSIPLIVAKQVKDLTEHLEKEQEEKKSKESATSLVGSSLLGLGEDSGVPVINLPEKLTGKDMKSGKSRQLLSRFLKTGAV